MACKIVFVAYERGEVAVLSIAFLLVCETIGNEGAAVSLQEVVMTSQAAGLPFGLAGVVADLVGSLITKSRVFG